LAKFLARFEEGNSLGWYFDWGSGFWIAGDAPSSLARVEGPECSGWTEKEGQVYVQPPVSVLEQLIAVRVHIDNCPVESGALRVVPKSHVEGRLNTEQAEALRSQNGETVVPVGRGGVLVMRPLLLHASSKATSNDPRRVLHFVFGPPKLPLGLEWRWTV